MTNDEMLVKVRNALAYLEDIAGMNIKNLVIIHTISPYDYIPDSYRIIDLSNIEDYMEGESMFISDTLEDLLWRIQQMY